MLALKRIALTLVATASLLGSGLALSTSPAQADPGEFITYWCDNPGPREPGLKDFKLVGTEQRLKGCSGGTILIESSSRGWVWMYGGYCSFRYWEKGGRSLVTVRSVCDAKAL